MDRNNHGSVRARAGCCGAAAVSLGRHAAGAQQRVRNKLTPRGAASYRLTKSTFCARAPALGITEPSLLQNFARDPWFVGNPDLRPEKTTSYEAGIVQEWFGRRLRTEVSAFANSFRDLIVVRVPTLPRLRTWQNIEASRARGLEFAAQAQIAAWADRERATYTQHVDAHHAIELAQFAVHRRRAGIAAAAGQFGCGIARSRDAAAVVVRRPARCSWANGRIRSEPVFGVTRNPGYQNVYAGGVAAHTHLHAVRARG